MICDPIHNVIILIMQNDSHGVLAPLLWSSSGISGRGAVLRWWKVLPPCGEGLFIIPETFFRR